MAQSSNLLLNMRCHYHLEMCQKVFLRHEMCRTHTRHILFLNGEKSIFNESIKLYWMNMLFVSNLFWFESIRFDFMLFVVSFASSFFSKQRCTVSSNKTLLIHFRFNTIETTRECCLWKNLHFLLFGKLQKKVYTERCGINRMRVDEVERNGRKKCLVCAVTSSTWILPVFRVSILSRTVLSRLLMLAHWILYIQYSYRNIEH